MRVESLKIELNAIICFFLGFEHVGPVPNLLLHLVLLLRFLAAKLGFNFHKFLHRCLHFLVPSLVGFELLYGLLVFFVPFVLLLQIVLLLLLLEHLLVHLLPSQFSLSHQHLLFLFLVLNQLYFLYQLSQSPLLLGLHVSPFEVLHCFCQLVEFHFGQEYHGLKEARNC